MKDRREEGQRKGGRRKKGTEMRQLENGDCRVRE